VEGRDEKSAVGLPIAATLATGYTFQGKLIRPALVQLTEDQERVAASEEVEIDPPVAGAGSGQSQVFQS
jgi:hypothetical protein